MINSTKPADIEPLHKEADPEPSVPLETPEKPLQVPLLSQVEPFSLANEPKQDDTPLWKKRSEHFGIFLAILVAIIYLGQLIVMNSQLEEMRGSGMQTDRWIALYRMQNAQMTRLAQQTAVLAEQAKRQAIASHQIAENAKVQSAATLDLAGETKTIAKTGVDQLEISQRPYVSTSPKLVSDLTYNTNGANLTLQLTSYNGGSTPAMNVFVYAKLFPGTVDPAIKKTEMEKTCALARLTRSGGTSIFHGDSHVVDLSVRYSFEDIRRDKMPGFNVELAVCTSYEGATPTLKPYSLATVFNMYRKEKANAGMFIFWDDGRAVPKDDIVVVSASTSITLLD